MESPHLHPELPQNIVLIGFMGSGKTTLGKVLHRSLSYPLIDTDHVIEEQEGKSISNIFTTDGEKSFRDLETSLLQSILCAQTTHHIISTGGGIVQRAENRKLLRQLGFVVWLSCSAEETYARTARNNSRPLLQGDDPMAVITQMLDQRAPFYEESSHLKISTSGLEFDEISCGILESARYHFAARSNNS